MDVLRRYRNHSNSSSDEESEDSDKECNVWKRAVKKRNDDQTLEKVQVEEIPSEPVEMPKRKRNTIWSDILEDQLISEDLGSCLLKNKPANYGSRGQESYDYTLKYADSEHKKDSDLEMSEDEESESEKRSVSSRNTFRPNRYVELDNTEKDAVRKINRVLNEKKVHLLRRVVKYIGIEKAMSLLKMTEEIEENGGMMIANHTRRRTPGGVYIQLLKTDKNIAKEIMDKIFEGEMSALELKKHFEEMKKKKKMYKEKKFLRKSKAKPAPKTDEVENMDATETCEATKENAEALILENNPPPPPPVVIQKKPDSDLEDGEIED